VDRRSFLTGVAAASAGLTIAGPAAAGQGAAGPKSAEARALDDPAVRHGLVSFKSGADTVKGFLARPKAADTYPALLIMHGDPGLPDWVRNTAARLAQAGYVGLVIDLNSRVVPDSTKLDKPLEFYISNTFDRQVTQDSLAAIGYLKAQPFTRPTGVGWVGFCGGGRKGLVLAAQCKDVRAVVSFYGAVRFTRKNAKDPMPDVMDVVKDVKAPVQGHYGSLDKVAPVADAKEFERTLKAQGTPVEMYYYEGAGHGFYGNTWKEQTPEFGYHAEAAEAAHGRMTEFLKHKFK
jgi:carboxymethylenebutenolidase